MFEWISSVPEWFGTALAGVVGWLAKTVFDTWKRSRLPFLEDQERFHAAMGAINPEDLYYFREPVYSAIPKRHLDGAIDSEHKLIMLHRRRPAYLHKKLGIRESELRRNLKAFNDEISERAWVHNRDNRICTIYWNQFDEWNADDTRLIEKIQKGLAAKREEMIKAFEAYRDYGNKLFAKKTKIEKHDS